MSQNNGKGVLYTNNRKLQPNHPDMTGDFTTIDGIPIRISAWIKQTPKGMLLSLSQDTFQKKNTGTYPKEVNKPSEDDIPF
jgi:hypothetical protein